MDIFDKCYDFTRADEVKAAGIYPYFHPLTENEGPEVSIDGRKMIMAGSNNYLGLTARPEVKEAAIKATERYGTGCSGSRYLTGTLDLHIELEKRLAKFLGKEDCLLYSTGYQTAFGVISTLIQKDDYIFSDRENHACIMHASVTAKGAYANFVRYKHSDMKDLERRLQRTPFESGKIIITDGVFSVTGEMTNLPKINELAKKYNARVLCDDAHAIGVIGEGGRGTASYFNQDKETDLIMGTFSKTFSSLGGFIAGEERVINYIKHHSSALIFSASPTPASVAATLKSLDILESEPELVEKLKSVANYMRKGFKKLELPIYEGETAIIPVIIGDDTKAMQFWKLLFDKGIYVNAFIPPGVPPELSMMRTSYMATHTKEHCDKILEVFESVKSVVC
jgi:8-amino-7-oxononanoate synthase